MASRPKEPSREDIELLPEATRSLLNLRAVLDGEQPPAAQAATLSAPPVWEASGELARLGKRMVDMAGAALLLLALSPLLALCAVLIKLTSPGPVLCGPVRTGRGRELFRMWKFRTMCVDAERVLERYLKENPAARAEWEERFKLRDDPRITRLGRILRRYSIDELPQLWNVLVGEMSMVGPRPLSLAEVPRYGARFAAYSLVRPGITGLWQVSGRSDTSYEYRMLLDESYATSWSMRMDFTILARTVGVVLGAKGAY